MKSEDMVFRVMLWKHDIKKNGQMPIYLYVGHHRDVKYFTTGFSAVIQDWDQENDCLKLRHVNYVDIVKKITLLTEEIKFEVKLAERNLEYEISLAEIKKRIRNKGKEEVKTDEPEINQRSLKILEFFDVIIKELEDEGNPGASDVFSGGKSPISRFLGGKYKDIHFTEFNQEKCAAFERFLRSLKLKETSMSIYLRTFYRIWNLAGQRGLHPKDPNQHPSKFIKFRAYKRIRTKKRAIPVNIFQAIAELRFPYESRLFRSQQYVLFSYYARGINFNDLCKLTQKHIVGNTIDYTRSKTDKQFQFELHPKALKIASLFRMYPMQSDNDYIFPILMKIHDTPRKVDQRIESALKDVNEDLKEFGSRIEFPGNLTSYVFRHSFATHLEQAGVDIKYIKEALGHETEEQTRIYLAEISDWRVANAVNNAIK